MTNGQYNAPKPDYLNGGEPTQIKTSMSMQNMLEKKNEAFTEINKKQFAEMGQET